jgi:hypothetical protein
MLVLFQELGRSSPERVIGPYSEDAGFADFVDPPG